MTLPERDAVLAHALHHAPEPAQQPSKAVRDAVLAHATKSIATSPYKTSVNSPKTPQKQSLSAWQRLLHALGLGNVGPTKLAGVMASLFVAVLVGVLWQDDDRRNEASSTGQVAATAPAALPAPAPAPTPIPASPPVPAAQADLQSPKAKTNADDRAQDKLLQRESESQRNSQVLAEVAAPPPSAAPAPVVAAAPAATAAPVMAAKPAPVPMPAAAPLGAAAPEAQQAPAADTARSAKRSAAPALEATSDGASALSSALEQIRLQGGLQCIGDKPCNTSPLQALLRSPLMRQAMARAQPDAGNTPTEHGNTVRTLRTVQWQALGDARPYSLAWNASTSTLHWRSPQGAFVVQLGPQDAAAMQEWFDAVHRP
jgi:hypothetical protein